MKKSFFLSVLSLLLVGCQTNSNLEPEPLASPVEENTSKQIVTSFYPLYFITTQIVGNQAEVINLADATDVHEYTPSPQDMVKLNQADLVIFQGAELEPWTEDLIPELTAKNIATLEVSHDLDLAKMDDHDDHDEHEDEPEDEEEDDHDDEHDEHHHGEFDPHTWLDPVLAQKMVEIILTALENKHPAQAATYKANAAELKNKFAQLDQKFQKDLSNCAHQEVIVAHDAYGYLASRYGFKAHAIAGLSPQDEPSAKVLAELKEEAAEGITHILVEANTVQRFATTLAEETGLKVLPINPLGRGTLDVNKDFLEVMNANLDSLKTALDCKS